MMMKMVKMAKMVKMVIAVMMVMMVRGTKVPGHPQGRAARCDK